jgi:hypothetical protein
MISELVTIVLLVKTGIQAELVPLPGLPAVMIELQNDDNDRVAK